MSQPATPAVVGGGDDCPPLFLRQPLRTPHAAGLPALPGTRYIPRPAFVNVPEARRRNLAAVKGKDTAPEMVVRRLLHSMGYRYRLQRRDLPGRPDIVLPGRQAVVDVRGCFWHRHPSAGCRNAVLPKIRADWWAAKLTRNVERDEASQAALEAAGWRVLVVWGCETHGNPDALTRRLAQFLGPVRGQKEKRTARQDSPRSVG